MELRDEIAEIIASDGIDSDGAYGTADRILAVLRPHLGMGVTPEQQEAIETIISVVDAKSALDACRLRNGRRGASQEACDEINRAGNAMHRAWDAITPDIAVTLRAIAGRGDTAEEGNGAR